MAKKRLTQRIVDKLKCPPGERELTVWDERQPGLAVRCYATGAKSYWVVYRFAKKPKWLFLEDVAFDEERAKGQLERMRHDAAEARRDALNGVDPGEARKAAQRAAEEARCPPDEKTVAGVARAWHTSTLGRKKESSRADDHLYIERFIVPTMGARSVASITFDDVERLHVGITNGSIKPPRKATGRGSRGAKAGGAPIMANRVRSCLSAIMAYAEIQGLRPRSTNPCHGVKKNREVPRHRALTDTELDRLAKAMDAWPTTPHRAVIDEATGERKERTRRAEALPLTDVEIAARRQAIDCIKTILLTGCRKTEVTGLCWSAVDEARAAFVLGDPKAKPRYVLLSKPALAIIWRQPRSEDDPRVFGAPADLKRAWFAVRVASGLGAFRVHDLRHTCGTTLSDLGYGDAVIAAVLGHSRGTVTSRYTQPSDRAVRAAVEAYGEKVGKVLGEWPVKAAEEDAEARS